MSQLATQNLLSPLIYHVISIARKKEFVFLEL